MKRYSGSCHCGFGRFDVEAEVDHARICNCSICYKRGALNFRVPDKALTLHTPLAHLTLYTWGSHTGKDYFCPRCGILPFRRPAALIEGERAQGLPEFDGWAINLRCLDGFDTDAVPLRHIPGRDIVLDV